MENTKDSQISNDIIPFYFYYFYNMAGVLHTRQGKTGLKFNLTSSVISTILLVVILYCFITYFNGIFIALDPKINFMSLLIIIINIGSQLVGQTLMTVMAIVNGVKLKFNNVLTPIIKVEKLLISMGSVGKPDGHSDELFISFLGVLLSVILVAENAVNNRTWMALIGNIVSQMYLVAVGLIFITLCKQLTSRFIRLNKVIVDYGNSESSNLLYSDSSNVSIQDIREAHFLLCEAIEEINSTFGVQLLVYFIYLFVEIIINPFFIVQPVIMKKETNKNPLFAILLLYILTFSIIQLVIVTEKSSKTSYHAKKTEFYVSSLLSPEMPPSAWKEIKYALLQISSNTQEFRVLDLFTIDLTIITSFAGMAVTYLIIILQFESASTGN